MSIAQELAGLFRRDLTRLLQQLHAFPQSAALWQCAPGVTNSAGNLMLHLEGNLREFVGRILGGVAYTRERDREFADREIPMAEMEARIGGLSRLVPDVIQALSPSQVEALFPENPLGSPMSTQQFLIHLHGHLNYHLGQID